MHTATCNIREESTTSRDMGLGGYPEYLMWCKITPPGPHPFIIMSFNPKKHEIAPAAVPNLSLNKIQAWQAMGVSSLTNLGVDCLSMKLQEIGRRF